MGYSSDDAHYEALIQTGKFSGVILGMVSDLGYADFGGQSVVLKPTKSVFQRYILLQKNDKTLHPRTEFVRLNAVISGVSLSGGGLNASQTKMKSDYKSAVEQSGIAAGDGGFQVDVGGQAHLKGGVIESTDKAVKNGKNSFESNGLKLEDLSNKAEYKASQTGVGVGLGASGLSVSPPSILGAKGDADSTTRAGISGIAGDKSVRTGVDETHKLGQIFDKDDIAARFAIVGELTKQVNTLRQNMGKESDDLRQAAKDEANPARKQELLDQAQKIDNNWGYGGTYSQITSALIAGVGGNVTGGASQMVQNSLVNYVQQQGAGYLGGLVTKGTLVEGSPAHAALHAILACAGAAASKASCGSGALGAAASSLLTNLFPDPTKDTTNEDKENRRNLLLSLVAGIAGIGGADLATALNAAQGATDNNYLSPRDRETLKQAKEGCTAGNAQACGEKEYLEKLNRQTDQAYLNAAGKCRSKGECTAYHEQTVALLETVGDYGYLSADYEMGANGNPGVSNLVFVKDNKGNLIMNKDGYPSLKWPYVKAIDRDDLPSYGPYQITSNTMVDFMKFAQDRTFLDADPYNEGSYGRIYKLLNQVGGPTGAGLKDPATFDATWKMIAGINPRFAEIQHQFIEKQLYTPAYNAALKLIPDLDRRSPVLKAAIWSCAVQHGGCVNGVIKPAWNEAGTLTDAQLIKKIYDLRDQYTKARDMDFTDRYNKEKQQALEKIK